MIWAEMGVELGVALAAGACIMIVIMTAEWMLAASPQAEQKGLALLRSWLSPEQAQQYDARKHFEVIGSDTGTRYRIRHGQMMNIDQLDSAGNTICGLCFLPIGNLAAGDYMLAQKIVLETFERRALAIANRSSRTTLPQIEYPIEQSPDEPLSLLQWIHGRPLPP
jgi:hypothetical protein